MAHTDIPKVSLAKFAADRNPANGGISRPTDVPRWIYDGFLSVQAGEDLGARRGCCTLQTPDNIVERLDPSMADRLARQHVSFVILHGYIGQGVANEMRDIVVNKPLARALRECGIRRVLYVQSIGQIFFEPLFAERPEARGWVQRTHNGEIPAYYHDWFGYVPCLNNDDFMTYIKNVFRTAMHELDLDGIFTDNYGYFSYACFCEHCQRRFREYLYRRYPTPESRRARFEFENLDCVTPPPFKVLSGCFTNNGIPDEYQIVDPVSQEWIRFRCERLGEVTRELNQTIKAARSDAVFFVNYIYGGTSGKNCAVFHGLWPEYIYPHADLVSAEVAGPPSVNEGGAAQGRMLLMKIAKYFGIPLSTCSFHLALKDFKRIYLAEGIAFNTAPVDVVGDIVRDDPPDWMREYQAFYHERRDLLGHAATVADCAVLHSFESLSFACTYPHESLLLCEQSLVQGGVTFDVIFNRDLEHLENYRSLFLANVFAMSRPDCERIAAWVRAGGALIATEDTSMVNEHFISWKGVWPAGMIRTRLLADLLGVEWPRKKPLTQTVGRGRVAFLPRITRPWSADDRRGKADQTVASSPRVFAEHSYGPPMPGVLSLPALSPNHRDILKAVDYALDGKRTIKVTAKGTVLSEVTQNEHGTFVHLLNWNEARPEKNIRVSLLLPAGRKPKRIELISPDAEISAGKLEFTIKKGRIEITVPRLLCYDILILRTGRWRPPRRGISREHSPFPDPGISQLPARPGDSK